MVEQTEQTVRQAPYIEERSEQLLASVFGDPNAERFKDEQGNFTETEEAFNLRRYGRAGVGRAIPKHEVAGFGPDQLDAMALARAGIGGFAPFMSTGYGTIGSGVTALQQGLPLTQQAAALTQAGAPLVQAGVPLIQEGAAGLTGADISQYFSPYQSYVTDEITKQGALATKKAQDAAQRYGAFGGSRQGVVEGTIAADTAARVGQAQATGYSQALQAAEAAKKRALYGGQGLGQLGAGLGQLGAGLGGIGSRFGQFGGQLGQLGGVQAGLGLDAQRAGLTDVSSLMGIGGLNQQLAQEGIDAARATEEARQLEPFTRIGWASDSLQGQPSSYSSYTTRPESSVSPFSQIAGLGMAGLGAYQKGLFG